jgi:hypothetical protein
MLDILSNITFTTLVGSLVVMSYFSEFPEIF